MGKALPPLQRVHPVAIDSVAPASRYRVDEDAAGGPTVVCDEAPGVAVRVDPKNTFSEASARKLGPRAIFLDGAGQFPPLVDSKAQIYNLDHHEGCVRAFTLATCEQALVLVVKGLDLGKGDWTIYANEPDLDCAFAIWLLLNHRRVRDLSDSAREVLLPLLRLEGATDANGREFASYCGIPRPALEHSQRRLAELFRYEQELRDAKEHSPPERTVALLRRFDEEVFTPAELASFEPIDEIYGHVEIGNDLVAVVCRDRAGIYAVEERLRALFGERLGLIGLESKPGRYTLRASAPLGAVDLDQLYASLNLLDPAVTGRPAAERWGGAEEIGGSPREHGSRIGPERLLEVVAWTYQRRPRILRKLLRVGAQSLALATLAAGLALLAYVAKPVQVSVGLRAVAPLLVFSGVAGLGSLWLTRRAGRGSMVAPAWRLPARLDWLWVAPFVLAGAALGGVWAPADVGPAPLTRLLGFGSVVVSAFGAEAWFRGWLHGCLLIERPERTAQDRVRLSRATLLSTVFYVAFSLAASQAFLARAPFVLPGPLDPLIATALGATLVGLSLGFVRERSRSLIPPLALHAAGAALLLWLQ